MSRTIRGAARGLGLRAAALATLLALAAGLIAACGGDDEQQQQQVAQQTPTQQQDQPSQPAPSQDEEPQSTDDPIVIGWVADFSGPLAEYGLEMETGAQLAVDHINAAGGLLGRSVELVTADTGTDPTRAVQEARRLVEVEGAVGLAGPVASSTTLPVGESVCGPLQVPCVTPAATSPQITLADDDGFLFRATLSDAAQGPVLAQLAVDQGYQRVGVLYRDDPYGQGLAEAFEASFSGEANLVAYQPVAQPSYLAELQRAAEGGAEALVVIAFEEAQVFIREALEQEFFDQFLFVDGSKSQDLIDEIGGEYLSGMPGTAQAPGPETPSLAAWQDAYISVHGELPALPFVAESYDAAMVLMLAIEAAGSTDGAAIRDALPIVSSPGGETVIAGAAGVAAGLEILRNGGDIDYEGAATTLNWNAAGDVTSGYIGIWQYTDDGIAEVRQVAFSLDAEMTVAAPAQSEEPADSPITLGWLADYSGAIAEFGPAIETGVRLAIKHINDAGGILGQSVELVTGDTGLDSTRAVEEARRLVEIEEIHALIGPLASGITLAVAEAVTGPAGIPTISPSATSPQISLADDDGFLFRSTVSDAAQGPVLAQLAADEGYSNVSVFYIDNPYGQGLAESFLDAWLVDDSGRQSLTVAFSEGQATYLAELQNVADANGEVLIAIAYPAEAQVFIREAIENGLFDSFLFVDGTRSTELFDAIGGEHLNGMVGTAPSPGPETPSLAAWQDAYTREYGSLPTLPYVAEAYDAAMVLMLAIEAAGSTDGAAIRDALPVVSSPGGETVIAGGAGVAAGLAALRNGSDINYEGAATTLDFNAVGDVTSGYIGIWRFNEEVEGYIEDLEQIPFSLE